MSQHSIMDEFNQGLAYVYDAQELLGSDAPSEQIMDCLDMAIATLEYFEAELTELEPR